MAEDKVAEKKTETKEAWTNYLALTTVVLAVCATLSTFKAGGYSTQTVLGQSRAANKWAHYQAKAIKGYLYEVQKERMELDIAAGDLPPGKRQVYADKMREYDQRLDRYEAERAALTAEAREFEAGIGEAQRHGQSFGLAVIFLQVAVLLNSIAALMKKKAVWGLGSAVGLAGLVAFANGFLLFW